jgi:hypothetical protein
MMTMGKLVRFILLLALFAPSAPDSWCASPTGPDLQAALRAVTRGLEAGSANTVSSYFSKMIDLEVPGYQGTYSRSQAGKILSDFFSDHKVQDFSISRQDKAGDGGYYAIGELTCGDVKYRVYLLIKEDNGAAVVPVLRINKL